MAAVLFRRLRVFHRNLTGVCVSARMGSPLIPDITG